MTYEMTNFSTILLMGKITFINNQLQWISGLFMEKNPTCSRVFDDSLTLMPINWL